MRVFPTDKPHPHQRKRNPLQLPGHNKARLSPVQPQNDWEKHTLGKIEQISKLTAGENHSDAAQKMVT